MITCSYVHVWRTSSNYKAFVLVWLDHLLRLIYFESMEKDEECGYDHTLFDDSSAQGGDKENCSVGEDNSNMCKDVVIAMKSMQSHVENDLHEDVELQSEL
jgi:fructose/tagatose bisphosphate aldolase